MYLVFAAGDPASGCCALIQAGARATSIQEMRRMFRRIPMLDSI
jgi:hypothetical protein